MSTAVSLGLALAALVLPFGAASAADEAHTLSLRLDWTPLGQYGPMYLAAEKGWFAKAGLDVKIEPGNGGVTTIQLVNSGQYDVGYAALSLMAEARSKGMSLISIACIYRELDIALLVPEDSAIKGPSDLKGKKLIFTAGSFEGPFIDAFLAKGGLTRDQVQLMNLGFSARVPTMVSGGADGLFGGAIGEYVVLSSQRPTRRIRFPDVGINVPADGFIVTEATLKKKGPALRSFVSIVAGAVTYTFNGHEEEAAQSVIRANPQSRLDPSQVMAQVRLSPPFLVTPATASMPIGFQTGEDWAAAIAVLEQIKMIPPGTKPNDYYTNDYLDAEIVKSIGAGGR